MDTWEYTDRCVTVRLSGELDHHAAAKWREEIDDRVQNADCRLLRLDLSGLTFMDSSGIGLIMGRYRLMQSRGGTVEVVVPGGKLRQMLYLAGVDRLHIVKEETV